MKIIKLSALFLSIGLFLAACNTEQPPQTVETQPYANDTANDELVSDTMVDEYWAKDNFDLQRIGPLLERSDDPREFEALLNSDDGINNLDLNGDGYVDYISVDEFEDRGPNERGLSLFTRFGPDIIQEIAQIFFYRDEPGLRGSRVLLMGNEQLYGDNQYYETNWLDRSIGLVATLFSDRDDYYRSPYYYDNYPSGYQLYEVVETPVYRTRIEQLYPQPVFVYTPAPSYITKIKIKSPHKDKKIDKIYAKLAKPTKEQDEFIRSNPVRPSKKDKADKQKDKGDDSPGRSGEAASRTGEAPGRVNNQSEDRRAEPAKGNPGQGNPAKPDDPGKAPKADNKPQKQGGEGKGPDKGKKP